jgi:hypothetical protein
MSESQRSRLIFEIGADIASSWTCPYFGAVPYIRAMMSLSTLRDGYGEESAPDIIAYFLANSGTWRGDDARRLKAELRSLISGGP